MDPLIDTVWTVAIVDAGKMLAPPDPIRVRSDLNLVKVGEGMTEEHFPYQLGPDGDHTFFVLPDGRMWRRVRCAINRNDALRGWFDMWVWECYGHVKTEVRPP